MQEEEEREGRPRGRIRGEKVSARPPGTEEILWGCSFFSYLLAYSLTLALWHFNKWPVPIFLFYNFLFSGLLALNCLIRSVAYLANKFGIAICILGPIKSRVVVPMT